MKSSIKDNLFKMVESGDLIGLRKFLENTDKNLIKINTIDENGNTALMLAIQEGYVEIAELLVDNGANPNIENKKSGKTAEDMAIDAMGEGKGNAPFSFVQNEAPIAYKQNLKKRINPLDRAFINFDKENIEKHQQTFDDQLLTAISNLRIDDNNLDLREVTKLLKNGANPNITFADAKSGEFGSDNSLLHKAALCSDPKLTELLLSKGADITAKNSLNKTPVNLAVENKGASVSILLSAEAKLTKTLDPLLINAIADLDPESPHLDLTKVEQALSKGANPNAIHVETENTAIHGACHFKDARLAKLLLKEGASISAKNKDGETPLAVAMSQQNTHVIHTLTSHDPLTRLTTTAQYKVEDVKGKSQKSPDSSRTNSPKSVTTSKYL